METMTNLEYAKTLNPNAPASWMTNGELVEILTQRDEALVGMRLLMSVADKDFELEMERDANWLDIQVKNAVEQEGTEPSPYIYGGEVYYP